MNFSNQGGTDAAAFVQAVMLAHILTCVTFPFLKRVAQGIP